MCTATDQGKTTPGDKILMSTETSCHFRLFATSLKKKHCMILYIFFHDFAITKKKGNVHLILPVTKDRLSSLLKTQNDINFGLAKTYVKP